MHKPSNNTTVPAQRDKKRGISPSLGVQWVFPPQPVLFTPIGQRPLVLGRGEESDVCIGGNETSRRHAKLSVEGGFPVLRDLESTNGVYVNGERIKQAILEPNAVVRLGDRVGVVVALDAGWSETGGTWEREGEMFVGPVLKKSVDMIKKVAPSQLPIVLEGETGSGKEVLARMLHSLSRRSGRFLAINCSAIPEELAEKELFGNVRGAFTGADRATAGIFREAHGGTLLLDEIIEMPLSLQPKLLRVIEQKELSPVGASLPVPVDVRLVVAAQESLDLAVSTGRFRSDLHGRLDGFTIRIPPLRERIVEIPFLFLSLLHKHSGGHPPCTEAAVIERLCLHSWPKNVRELETIVKRLLVLHGHEKVLTLSHLADVFPVHPVVAVVPREVAWGRDADHERRKEELDRLMPALRRCAGNVARAALQAGISRQRAYRLVELHGVDLESMRGGERE